MLNKVYFFSCLEANRKKLFGVMCMCSHCVVKGKILIFLFGCGKCGVNTGLKLYNRKAGLLTSVLLLYFFLSADKLVIRKQ